MTWRSRPVDKTAWKQCFCLAEITHCSISWVTPGATLNPALVNDSFSACNYSFTLMGVYFNPTVYFGLWTWNLIQATGNMAKKQVAISVKIFTILCGGGFDSKRQVWLTLVNSTNQLYGAGGLANLHFLLTADSLLTYNYDINKMYLNKWY